MILQFQSICILASVSILIQNNQEHAGYAFLLFVVGVLSHALEAVYEHHNMAEDRKAQAIQNLFGKFDFKTDKSYDYKKMMEDWDEEANEEKDLK